MSNSPVLKFVTPTAPTEGEGDASEKGIGFELMQQDLLSPMLSEPQIQEIHGETAKDPVLRFLKAVILNGWPNQGESLPTELRQYFNVRDELAAQDGVTMKFDSRKFTDYFLTK